MNIAFRTSSVSTNWNYGLWETWTKEKHEGRMNTMGMQYVRKIKEKSTKPDFEN